MTVDVKYKTNNRERTNASTNNVLAKCTEISDYMRM